MTTQGAGTPQQEPTPPPQDAGIHKTDDPTPPPPQAAPPTVTARTRDRIRGWFSTPARVGLAIFVATMLFVAVPATVAAFAAGAMMSSYHDRHTEYIRDVDGPGCSRHHDQQQWRRRDLDGTESGQRKIMPRDGQSRPRDGERPNGSSAPKEPSPTRS